MRLATTAVDSVELEAIGVICLVCGPCVAGGLQNEQRQMLLTKEAVREALKEDRESNKTVRVSDVNTEVWNIIQGNASKTPLYADLLLTLLSNQSHP